MKYILFSDLAHLDEPDDGMYLVKISFTEDDLSEPAMELFSEGDLYRIRKKAPPDADGIAFTDDWMFFNSKKMMFFDYVFTN